MQGFLLPYGFKNVRSAGILTGSYVAGTIMGPTDTDGDNPANMNQMEVYVQLTLGSLTSADVKIEFSHDQTYWVQETFDSIAAGVDTESLGLHRMSTTGNYRLSVPIKDKYIKISALGNGNVSGSSMTIDATVGVV